ncbi:hypothetical protein GF345_06310 [Candidatus Woesearchaeota archaeon]|nr:hypothetical protein [Candidatus Woesearchaeota archaeon]
MDFNQIMIWLDASGFLDVILPIFLIFALVFAVLSGFKMFNKATTVVIGFLMGLATVIPHVMGRYPPCWDIVVIINNALPRIALAIVGIILFMTVLGIIGLNIDFFGKFMSWIALLVFAFVAYTFATARGPGCTPMINVRAGPIIDLIIVFGVFGLLAWWIMKGGEKG